MDIYDGRPLITVEDQPALLASIIRGSIGHIALGEDPGAFAELAKNSVRQLDEAFRLNGLAYVDPYAVVVLDIPFVDLEMMLAHQWVETSENDSNSPNLRLLCEQMNRLHMRAI